MAKLVIVGDRKHLEVILKRSRLVASKYGLSSKITDDEQEDLDTPVDPVVVDPVVVDPVEKLPKHAADLIALIEKVENLGDLEKFESDKRVTVVEAVNLKREELDLA